MLHPDSLRHARGALRHWLEHEPDVPDAGYAAAIELMDAWLGNGGQTEPVDEHEGIPVFDPLVLAALGKVPGMLREKPRGSDADIETADEIERIVRDVSGGQDMLVPPVGESA